MKDNIDRERDRKNDRDRQKEKGPDNLLAYLDFQLMLFVSLLEHGVDDSDAARGSISAR